MCAQLEGVTTAASRHRSAVCGATETGTEAAKPAGARWRLCVLLLLLLLAEALGVYHLPRMETCSRRRCEALGYVTWGVYKQGRSSAGGFASALRRPGGVCSEAEPAGAGGGVGGLTDRVVFTAGGGLVEQRHGRARGRAGPVAAELERVELECRAGVGVGGGARVEEDGEGGCAGELAAREVVLDKAGGVSSGIGGAGGGAGGRRVLAHIGGAGGADGVKGELRGVAVEPEGVRGVGGVWGGAHEEGEELDGAREGDGDEELWAEVGAEDGGGLEAGGLGLEEARELVLGVAEVVGGEAGGVDAVVEGLGDGGGDGGVAVRMCV